MNAVSKKLNGQYYATRFILLLVNSIVYERRVLPFYLSRALREPSFTLLYFALIPFSRSPLRAAVVFHEGEVEAGSRRATAVEKERSLRKGERERAGAMCKLDFEVAMSLLADVYAIKHADKKSWPSLVTHD